MSDEMTPATPTEASADNSKIAKATAGISVLTAAGFATGLIIKMILSRLLGTTVTANAYNHVYRLTQDIFRSWDKLVRPTFLPALALERERVGHENARQFTNSFINVQVLLLGLLTALLMIFPRLSLQYFTKFQQVEATSLATRFLVCLAPAVLFLSLAVTGYMLLNSYKRFHLAAFGDHVFVKLVPLVALVMLWYFFGIYALIAGVVFGTAAKLVLYGWGLRRELKHYRLRVQLVSPAMKKMLLLMLPLAVGVVVSFVRNRFEDNLLTQVQGGSAATIVPYSKALVDVPIQLFPVAMSIAVFPFLSDYFLRKQHKELFAVLGKGLRIIFLVFLPLTVGLMILARPVIDVAFGGGKFTAQAVTLTARSLQFYAVGYVVFGLEILLLQFFYAAHNTLAPTLTGIVTSTLQIAVLYLTVGRFGIITFTMAYSASKAVKVAILLVLLVGVYPHISLWLPMLKRTGVALLKVAVTTAVMGAVVYLLSPVVEGWLRPGLDNFLLQVLEPLLPQKWSVTDAVRMIVGIIHLAVVAGVGALVFAVGVHVLGVEEWRQALDWVKRKLKRR